MGAGENQISTSRKVGDSQGSNSECLIDPSRWVERYGSVLFQYAMVRVRCSQTAEDLVQETLLAALKARDRFAGQASEQTWLTGILSHKIKDFFRKTARRHVQQLNEQTGPSTGDFDNQGFWIAKLGRWPTTPEQVLESREFWSVFEECLSELDPSLLAAFALREFDRLSTEEICETLDVSANNARVRLYRARVLLRRCLEANWFDA